MAELIRIKQERFARFVASGMALLDAYISAGFSPLNAKRFARLLAVKPKIVERVQELKLTPSASALPTLEEVHTRAKVIAELMLLAELAKGTKSWSAAIRAQELLGKELGMFSDKADGFEWDGDINKLSKLQRAKLKASLENMVRDNNGRRQVIEGSAIRSEGEAVHGEAEGVEGSSAVPESVATVGPGEAQPSAGGVPGEPAGDGGMDHSGDRPAPGDNPFEPW